MSLARLGRGVRGWLCAGLACVCGGEPLGQLPWRVEFDRWPESYSIRGRLGTALAVFELDQLPEAVDGHVLRMKADRASGSLLIPVPRLAPETPVLLRWRWRVLVFPTGADGRIRERDDQAIGVYVGTEGGLRRRALSYRWETETPVGQSGEAVYAGGLVRVRWICLRNANDGPRGFVTEERNLVADWQDAFGESLPSSLAISISCNAQYTGTKAVAELDWIELDIPPGRGQGDGGKRKKAEVYPQSGHRGAGKSDDAAVPEERKAGGW